LMAVFKKRGVTSVSDGEYLDEHDMRH
jgi:hypothetical protein